MKYYNYRELKYRSKDDYSKIIKGRLLGLRSLPLTAMNGKSVNYTLTDKITGYIKRIGIVYKKLEMLPYTNTLENEALTTCIIEGARTTLETTIRLAKGERPSDKSEQMIYNIIKALHYIENMDIASDKFSEEALVDLWRIVVDKACDNIEIIGSKYRSGNVLVVNSINQIRFQAPDHKMVQPMMECLMEFMRINNLHPLLAAIIIHYYFVYVHPFCDGNGRMARLLMKQYLINKGYSKFAYIPITAGVINDLKGYYTTLEDSENEYNDVTFFIVYYLNAIYYVLKNTYAGYGNKMESIQGKLMLNERQIRIVKFLKKNKYSFITQSRYAEMYNIKRSRAAKELNELVDFRLLNKEKHRTMIYKWYEYQI